MDSDQKKILIAAIDDPAVLLSLSQTNLVELAQLGAILKLIHADSEESIDSLHAKAFSSYPGELFSCITWALGILSGHHPEKAGLALFDIAVRLESRQTAEIFLQKKIDLKTLPGQILLTFLFDHQQKYQNLDPGLKIVTKFTLDSNVEIQKVFIQHAETNGETNWALMLKAAIFASEQTIEQFLGQFEFMTAEEKTFCLSIFSLEKFCSKPAIQDAVCKLFIHFSYRPALVLALEKGFYPSNEIQTALFYFLAEEWEQYYKLDFNYRLLTAGYELANSIVKKRLVSISRSAGKLDWTQQLSSGSRRYWLGDLTDHEWQAVIDILQKERRQGELWKLAQAAPPAKSAVILNSLHADGWSPDNPEDLAGYVNLCLVAATLVKSSLPISLRTTWLSPSKEFASPGFDPVSNIIAGGTSQSAIHLWRLTDQANELPPIYSPVSRTYALAISPGGEYLAAASSDHSIRLFRLSDGRLVKTMTAHEGVVRALAFSPDGKTLHSGSFDHTIRHWRIPQGTPWLSTLHQDGEVFNLAISGDGRFLLTAGADRCLTIYRYRDMQPLSKQILQSDTVTTLAVANMGSICATTSRNQVVNLVNYTTILPPTSFESPKRIVTLAFDQKGNKLLTGQLDGEIAFWDVSSCKQDGYLHFHENAVNGLFNMSNGETLISSSPNGELCWWDLRIWKAQSTPVEDLSTQWSKLQKGFVNLRHTVEEVNWMKFMGTLIDWRRRHDIQIGDSREILKAGEFDIEL